MQLKFITRAGGFSADLLLEFQNIFNAKLNLFSCCYACRLCHLSVLNDCGGQILLSALHC